MEDKPLRMTEKDMGKGERFRILDFGFWIPEPELMI
jgi:hypothetical protein